MRYRLNKKEPVCKRFKNGHLNVLDIVSLSHLNFIVFDYIKSENTRDSDSRLINANGPFTKKRKAEHGLNTRGFDLRLITVNGLCIKSHKLAMASMSALIETLIGEFTIFTDER